MMNVVVLQLKLSLHEVEITNFIDWPLVQLLKTRLNRKYMTSDFAEDNKFHTEILLFLIFSVFHKTQLSRKIFYLQNYYQMILFNVFTLRSSIFQFW